MLKPCGQPYGVFYPLQTFSKDNISIFDEIPILIEGSDLKTNEFLFDLGESISENVRMATGADRQKIHVAAVFASNFTNRMLAAAEEILHDTNDVALAINEKNNANDSTLSDILGNGILFAARAKTKISWRKRCRTQKGRKLLNRRKGKGRWRLAI